MIEKLNQINKDLLDMWRFDSQQNNPRKLTDQQSLKVIKTALNTLNILRYRKCDSTALQRAMRTLYDEVYKAHPLVLNEQFLVYLRLQGPNTSSVHSVPFPFFVSFNEKEAIEMGEAAIAEGYFGFTMLTAFKDQFMHVFSKYSDGYTSQEWNVHCADESCEKHGVPYREQYGKKGRETIYGICDYCANES